MTFGFCNSIPSSPIVAISMRCVGSTQNCGHSLAAGRLCYIYASVSEIHDISFRSIAELSAVAESGGVFEEEIDRSGSNNVLCCILRARFGPILTT
jgi:hypothetical protein